MDTTPSATLKLVSRDGQDGAPSLTRLRGRKLLIARVAYFALLFLLLGLFAAGVPAQLQAFGPGNVGIRHAYNSTGETVLMPTVGLPAASAGIQDGDILVAINGSIVQPWAFTMEIDRRLLGPVGTQVSLNVRSRDGATRPYTLIREARGLEQVGFSADAYAPYFTLLDIIRVLGFLIPALIVFWRKSDDWLAMFVSIALVLTGVNYGVEIFYFLLLHSLWLTAAPLIGLVFKASILVFFYIFPDGQFVPPGTRQLALVGVLWAGVFLLPYPYHPFTWPYFLGNLFDLALYATGIYAQVYRYRRVSSPRERQQTKWVVFGMAVAFVGVYAYGLPQFIFPALQESTAISFRYQLLGQLFLDFALLALPLTVSISILRYRLYDIDIILSRTLVYVPLTAILAGLYTASVTLSSKLLVALTDQQSDLATGVAILVVVMTFTPLKDQLQKFVDKHFKQAHDPATRLKAFGEPIKSRMFVVAAKPMLHRLLAEAVEAFDARGGAAFLEEAGRLQLVYNTDDWDADARITVALESGGLKLGAISLGARRNGADYTADDREVLLKTAELVALAIEQDRS